MPLRLNPCCAEPAQCTSPQWRSCLGPVSPLLGGETAAEVGGSFWVWYIVMALTRATYGCGALVLATTDTTYLSQPYENYGNPLAVNWVPLHLPYWYCLYGGVVYCHLALYSFYCTLSSSPSDVPAKILGPLYYIAVSAAFHCMCSFEGLWVIGFDLSLRMVLIFSVIIDILCCGARIRFRVSYILLPQIILIINTVFRSSYGLPLRLYEHGLLFASSVVAILFSRITICCFPPAAHNTSIDEDEENDSQTSNKLPNEIA